MAKMQFKLEFQGQMLLIARAEDFGVISIKSLNRQNTDFHF